MKRTKGGAYLTGDRYGVTDGMFSAATFQPMPAKTTADGLLQILACQKPTSG